MIQASDTALRDFSARCLHEFLKWAIKQTTTQVISFIAFTKTVLFGVMGTGMKNLDDLCFISKSAAASALTLYYLKCSYMVTETFFFMDNTQVLPSNVS